MTKELLLLKKKNQKLGELLADRDALLLKQQSQLSELTTKLDALRAYQVSFFSSSPADISLRDTGDTPEDEGGDDDPHHRAAPGAFVTPGDEGGASPQPAGEGVGLEGVLPPGVRAAEEQRLHRESAAAALRGHGARHLPSRRSLRLLESQSIDREDRLRQATLALEVASRVP